MSPETVMPRLPVAGSRPLHSQVKPRPTDEALSRLFEELVANALQVSLTASIAAGLAQDLPGLHREAIGRYLPSRPSVLPIIVVELATTADGAEIADALLRFDASLARCKSGAISFSSSIEYDSVASEAASLEQAWLSLAAELQGVMALLAERRPTAISASHDGITRLAIAQLEAVVKGQSPFLDRHGRLVIPLVAERRERARAAVSQHIYVSTPNSIQRVLITDVTTRGLGVWGLRGVAVGDQLSIMMAPGKSIDGQVVWLECMRAGLKLGKSDIDGNDAVREIILGADSLAE